MPINKSYGQEMDKRTRELEKRSTGKGANALQEQQLAQNQLQAIQNEQRSNLMSQRTEAAAMAQQNQLLSQAADLGVSSSTAATLGKYGLKTPPRVQRQQGRQVNVTPNKITVINNTNTTTNNQYQGGGGAGDNGSATKFKTWLNKVNMQQAEQASKRDRDYARRESSLTRSANKMLRRIEKVGSSVAESFSPQNFGQTVGSQLKTYLLIFGMRFLTRYWDKILDGLGWFQDTFTSFVGWLGIGDKGKQMANEGKGLVPTIVKLFGGDPKKENVGQAFTRSMKAAFDHFSLKLEHMYEQRAEAIKKVKSPFDGGKAKGLLGEALKDSGIDELFSGISTYLGDILTALVNPKAGVKNNIANSIRETGNKGSKKNLINSTEDYKNDVDLGDYAAFSRKTRRYAMDHNTLTQNGRDLTNNMGAGVYQSLDILGAYQDAKTTGYVDPARVIAGLERLQRKARSSGYVVVDKDFINQMYDLKILRPLLQAKHIRLVNYKLVEEERTEWEKKKAGESISLTDNMGWYAGAGAVVGTVAFGQTWLGAGVGSAIGAGVNGIRQWAVEDYALRLVPMSDPRPAAATVQVYEVDEFALRTLARSFGAEGWDAGDERLLRQLQNDIYQKAGGRAATKRRYRGRGSNESVNMDKAFRELNEYDQLVAAQKREEETDEFSIRQQRVFDTAGEIGDAAVNTVKSGYRTVASFYNDNFVKPGGKSETYYSPEGYVNPGGVGQRSSAVVHQVKTPTPPKYGGIRMYVGSSGILKSPYSTEYSFSTDSAAKEAERLCKYIINNDGPNKGGWQEKSPGAKGKTEFTTAYARLAIARGLSMNDLPKHPSRACDYVEYLYLFGFYPVEWNGYSSRKGDICVFGPTREHPNGYISIYTGARWVSDFTQGELWPYDDFKAEKCATVFRHLNAVSGKSSNKVTGGIDMTPDAIGYIDFNGDGIFDAVKTPEGVYKLDENGNVTEEKLGSNDLSTMWGSDSTISYATDISDDNSERATLGTYESSLGLTHTNSYTVSRTINGSDPWVNAVKQMGNWYKVNITRWGQQRNHCGIDGIEYVRNDCSGFVSACLVLYGVKVYDGKNSGSAPRAAMIASSPRIAQMLEAGGFQRVSKASIQPFDILANGHHTEIVAEKVGEAYNCGSTKTMSSSIKMPSPHPGFLSECTTVWRHVTTPSGYGTSAALQQTNDDLIISSWDASAADYGTGGGYGEGYSYSGGPGNDGQTYTGTGKLNNDGRIRRGVAALNYLQAKGFSYEQALGIVSNLAVESQMDPWADNHVGARGIAQWEGDRLEKMKAFVGPGWENNLQGQLDFLIHELNTSEKAALQKIMGTNDPALVAEYFGDLFERFKGHENKNHERYRTNRDEIVNINNLYGTNGGTAAGLSGLGDNSSGLPALPDNIDNQIDGAIDSVKVAFNDVTSAIKNIIPGLEEGKTEIITHDDKVNEKLKAMSDDQLAAQIWNTNSVIRDEYGALGFESWKKNQFDKLSRKNKQRYLIEAEARNILKATNYNYLDENGKSHTLNAVGDILGIENFDPTSPTDQNKFAAFYASLSPKDRRDLSARMQMGKSWGEIKENILETTDYNRLGYSEHTWKGTEAHQNNVSEIHKMLNAIYFNPKSIDGIDKILFQGERAGEIFNEDDLSRAIQLGDIEKIKKIIGSKLSSYGKESYESALGKQGGWEKKEGFKVGDVYYDGDSDWDKYAKRFNTNYIDHRLARVDDYRIKSYNDYAMRMLLAMTQTPELYQKYQKNIADIIESENFDKLRDLSADVEEISNSRKESSVAGDPYADLIPTLVETHGGKAKVAEIIGKNKDGVTTEDIYNQLVNFRAKNYDIAKNKYIQLHLTDDFLNVDENTSAQDAYHRQQVNRQLAERNERIAEIEFARGHRHMELEKRAQQDPKFARELAFYHGIGYGAMNSYDENEGKEELDAMDKEYTDLWAEKMQLLGEGDKNTPKRLQKLFSDMKEAKTAVESGAVVSDERQKRLADYATTPEEFRRRFLDEHVNNVSKDKWLAEHVNQYGIKEKVDDEYKWEQVVEYDPSGATYLTTKPVKTGRKIYSYQETEESKKAWDEARQQGMLEARKALVDFTKGKINHQLEDLSKGELASDQLKVLFDEMGIGNLFGDWKKFTSKVKKDKLQLGEDQNLISVAADGTLVNNLTGETILGANGKPMVGIEAFDTLDMLDDTGAVSKDVSESFVATHLSNQARKGQIYVGYDEKGRPYQLTSKQVHGTKAFDPQEFEDFISYLAAIEEHAGYKLDEVEKTRVRNSYNAGEDITITQLEGIPGSAQLGGKAMAVNGEIQVSESLLNQMWNNASKEAVLYGFETDQAKIYDEMKFHANLELQQKLQAINAGQLSFEECMLGQLMSLNDGMVKLIGATQAKNADVNGDGVIDEKDLLAGMQAAQAQRDAAAAAQAAGSGNSTTTTG